MKLNRQIIRRQFWFTEVPNKKTMNLELAREDKTQVLRIEDKHHDNNNAQKVPAIE